MATCDAYYRFHMVDIGGAGSNHDSSTFQQSVFGNALLNNLNLLHLPEYKMLPSTETALPCFLVADQAFPLNKRIMRPYPGKNLTYEKLIFNYRLSRARRVIENTFGILVQRWRILRKTILGDITTCELIVKAAVVMHNYLQKNESDLPLSERKYCPTGYVDHYDKNGALHMGSWRNEGDSLNSIQRVGSNNSARKVQEIRDTLAKYFLSNEGGVSWQYDRIKIGSNPL